MIKLFPVSSSFGINVAGLVILLGGLIFFTNSIIGLSITSTVLGQEEYTISNSSGLINQGKYQSNIGNYTKAVTYFDKVLEAEPDNTEALNGKALSIDSFGNHTEAADIYDEILSIEPDNMDALASKGVILFNTGNHTEAIKYFKKKY